MFFTIFTGSNFGTNTRNRSRKEVCPKIPPRINNVNSETVVELENPSNASLKESTPVICRNIGTNNALAAIGMTFEKNAMIITTVMIKTISACDIEKPPLLVYFYTITILFLALFVYFPYNKGVISKR